ncbi:MAG: putative signal transduction histidine kinase [Gaiellaceae bacterium]|nr:putative signal transduction histidine kinase [Gaiellaceae bacterium]
MSGLTAAPAGSESELTVSGLAVPTHRTAIWAGVWLAGGACTVAALWPLLTANGAPVTAADVIYRVTGGSFVAAGLIAWQRRPANRVGVLMTATGFLFFLAPLAAQVDSPLVQTFGRLATDYWTITFVVLLLVFPQSRRLRGRLEHLLVVAFAIPLVVAQPLWLMVLADEGPANVLRLWPNERAADWIDKGQRGLLLASVLVLFLVLVWRWWQATPPLRRVLVPVLAGGATMLSFGALLTLDLINGARSQPLLTATIIVLATVPVAFLAGLLRSRLARVAVGDFFVGLREAPTPVELRDALRTSLGDPSLELLYWLPEFGTYADVRGRADAPPEPDGVRTVTAVHSTGEWRALLVHDAALLQEPELLGAATAAARVAFENAQLHVELQARLEELTSSRARIVEAGQKERQRLERDLHDGAQQRLVALSLELRLLEERLAHDPEARRRLDLARREVGASLEELRELAHGLHPAVVSGHGLAVALESLAARAPVPVRLTVVTDGRLPEALEIAAYYLVAETLANVGKYARASAVSVDVTRACDAVVIEVADDGVGGADTEHGTGLRGLADRVETLGGRLRIWSPAGGGTRVRAEIPCVP